MTEATSPVVPPTIREEFGALRKRALVVAAVFGALSALGALLDLQHFLRSWLVAFLFTLAFPLGSLVVVQIHHLTGGRWGLPVRRMLEGATRTLPWMAVLFLPIALGVPSIYEWSHADVVAGDPILAKKAPYLNVPFFYVRAAIYFTVWIGIATMQSRFSERMDRFGDSWMQHRMRKIAGPGIGLYAITVTFASIDWAMSLEPHWFSSLYGVVVMVGQVLSTMALSILLAAWLSKREPFGRFIQPDQFHDLGKLMFACVMLWGYVHFSQGLIIWSANLAEETPYYLRRTTGSWEGVSIALVVFHFALPFLVLLGRGIKRHPRALATVALLLIGMRWLDVCWMVVPAFGGHAAPGEAPHVASLSWLDVVTPIAMASFWFATFLKRLEGRPLISLQDAHLEGLLEGTGPVAAAEH